VNKGSRQNRSVTLGKRLALKDDGEGERIGGLGGDG